MNMDKDILHLIIGIVAVIFGVFVGKKWGVFETWIKAHVQIMESAVKAAEASAESHYNGELAKVKAAYRMAVEGFEAKMAEVEARAAADLAQAKADADAELAKAKAAIAPIPAAPVVADPSQAPTAQA